MKNPFMGVPIMIIVCALFMVVYVWVVGSVTELEPIPPPLAQTSETASDLTMPSAAAPTAVPVPPVEPAEKEGVKTWAGIYVGRTDNNFIEINMGDEARTFLAPLEITGTLLNKGDVVCFDCYKNNNGQLTIVSIKKLVPAPVGQQ